MSGRAPATANVHRRCSPSRAGRKSWLTEQRAVHAAAPEKGGHLTGLALGAKIADKVAHRAMAQAELLGDLRHWATLDKKGPQNFVAALQNLVGFEEELLAEKVVVHDLPPNVSPNYCRDRREIVTILVRSEQGQATALSPPNPGKTRQNASGAAVLKRSGS